MLDDIVSVIMEVSGSRGTYVFTRKIVKVRIMSCSTTTATEGYDHYNLYNAECLAA